MQLKLDPEFDAAADLQQLVLEEIEDILRAAATVDEDRAHRIHVSGKRIRSYLRLLRGALGEKRYKKENRFFRDFGRPFGAVRNAEVSKNTVDALMKAQPDVLAPETIEKLRETAYLPPPPDTSGTGFGAVMAAMTDARARFEDPAPGKVRLKREIRQLYRDGRRLFRCARADPTADNLHEWRKQAKYLRFALAAIEENGPAGTTVRQRLKKLGKRLGDHHDLSLLKARADGKMPEAQAIIDTQLETLQKQVLKLGRKVYGRKPKRFIRLLAQTVDAGH